MNFLGSRDFSRSIYGNLGDISYTFLSSTHIYPNVNSIIGRSYVWHVLKEGKSLFASSFMFVTLVKLCSEPETDGPGSSRRAFERNF